MSDLEFIVLFVAIYGIGIAAAWFADRYEVHVSAIREEEYLRGFHDGRFTKKPPPHM
ncbi:MAG TPA: hypothetical protein VN627_03695 [Novosphingobium sp.]|nr:hypothetical protein [Novosphingobium sp.]